MKLNKIDSMIVNNYDELSEAIKKLFVYYFIDNHFQVSIDYSYGKINEEQIISMAGSEHIEDFCETFREFFVEQPKYPFKHFFRRIKSGNSIKCNFPVLVCFSGIIELNNVHKVSEYKNFYSEDFKEKYHSLEEIARDLKKEVYVYLGLDAECYTPIKKNKEEVVEFIKKNSVVFMKDCNSVIRFQCKDIWLGRMYSGNSCYSVAFAKNPVNKKVEKICSGIIF